MRARQAVAVGAAAAALTGCTSTPTDGAVGRPIAELEVDELAGSSGTPVGFNDALDQIRDQAAGPGAQMTGAPP